MLVAIVTGVMTGLGSGLIAALATPWVAWKMDQRRDRDRRRAVLVESWRKGLEDTFCARDAEVGLPEPNGRRELLRQPWYQSLRERLTPAFRDELEAPSTTGPGGHVVTIATGRMRDPLRDQFAAEIARIEKEWNLI